MIESNFLKIKSKIEKACNKSNRDINDIKLLAVSKRKPLSDLIEYQEVCKNNDYFPRFGENYVQEFSEKYDHLSRDSESHLIGNLQSNKAKEAVRIFDVIQTVDRLKIAKAINKEASKINKVQKILLQVNISRDENKSGILEEDLEGVFLDTLNFKNINIIGLMTITKFYSDSELVRQDYRKFRELSDKIRENQLILDSLQDNKLELSMGMSGDYEIAIEEGASIVRVGTALFGERN
ncbi:UNVERIFIED_CONTAM: hypothetical protein GTU68_015951 [Idotea baltica]|nr:hypothetical protein [Idotea baltica]